MPELSIEKRPKLKRNQIAHILDITINKNHHQINPKPILPKKPLQHHPPILNPPKMPTIIIILEHQNVNVFKI